MPTSSLGRPSKSSATRLPGSPAAVTLIERRSPSERSRRCPNRRRSQHLSTETTVNVPAVGESPRTLNDRWGRPTRAKKMHHRRRVARKPDHICDRLDCAAMDSVIARDSDSRHTSHRAEVCHQTWGARDLLEIASVCANAHNGFMDSWASPGSRCPPHQEPRGHAAHGRVDLASCNGQRNRSRRATVAQRLAPRLQDRRYV